MKETYYIFTFKFADGTYYTDWGQGTDKDDALNNVVSDWEEEEIPAYEVVQSLRINGVENDDIEVI